jgi:hypothetical protein
MRVLFMLPVLASAMVATACSTSPASTAGADSVSPPAQATAPAPTVAAPAGPPDGQRGREFTGTIAEAMDAGEYTYARLQGGGQDVWIAATRFDATPGRAVMVSLDMPMENFESKTLNRTFPLLYFVSDIALDGRPLVKAQQAAPPSMMTSHGAASDAGRAPAQLTKMPPPTGGLSVADVIAKRGALAGRPVTINGTVVKFNGGIMDRNWLHVQDGSGSEEAGTHDLTVTTTDTVKVGDIVTVSGIVGTNKDFGAGYAYGVIIEQAQVRPKP